MNKIIYHYISLNKNVCIYELFNLFKCEEWQDFDRVCEAKDQLIEQGLIEKYYYYNTEFYKLKGE